MKKITIILFFFCSIVVIAQTGADASWMKQLQKEWLQKNNTKEPAFKEIQQAFIAYWKTQDKNAKRSGYIPFKRWEHIWKSRVDANGYLVNKL